MIRKIKFSAQKTRVAKATVIRIPTIMNTFFTEYGLLFLKISALSFPHYFNELAS